MRTYATDADIVIALPEYDTANATQNAQVASLLTLATALIDSELETLRHPQAEQVFEAPPASAAARIFYGSGLGMLHIGRVKDGDTVIAANVTMPSGFTVPTFTHRGEHLITTDASGTVSTGYPAYSGWIAEVPVTVTAKWGWTTVPGDIRRACVLVVEDLWRRRRKPLDTNYPTQPSTPVADGGLPEEVIRILDRYLRRAAILGAVA